MGLTSNSSGLSLLRENFNLNTNKDNFIIALAGNPNTGKSTVFNALTGLKQHTGNWPGKTVTQAQGYYSFKEQEYTLVDLPGAYSLLANSTEEKIARDFICLARPNATIVVADATNLQRNLNLVLQVMELTDNTILCLNLMDEAKRKGIDINIEGLKKDLNIPVVPTVARDSKGLKELKKTVYNLTNNNIKVKPLQIKYSNEIEKEVDQIVKKLEVVLSDIKEELNIKWLALRLLEGDKDIAEYINKLLINNHLVDDSTNNFSEGVIKKDEIKII